MADEQPFVDYCRLQQGAEEAASSVVDVILKSGGETLYQKYLKRKAFVFAQENIVDNVISHLEMGFVAHDPGEEGTNDFWGLEEEPVPTEIDSWARMHLPQRRRGDEDGLPATRRNIRRMQTTRVRNSDKLSRSRAESAPKRSENRMFPLAEELQLDDEEESLREKKAAEKQRMVEKENKARQAEKVEEQERARVTALHEEMSRKPHTFDNEGNIIWIEEPKPDRLPKVQEAFPYTIKRDPRRPAGDETLSKTQLSASQGFGGTQGLKAAEPKKGAKKRDKKARISKLDDAEFTDFFAKLQHGQPPILETMVVKAGVTLESNGRKKDGPPLEKSRQMSRKEYVQLAEHELAEGYGSDGSPDKGKGEGRPSSAPDGDDGLGGLGDVGEGGDSLGASGSLPAIQGRGTQRFAGGPTRGVGQAGPAADSAGGEARVKGEVQREGASAKVNTPMARARSAANAIGNLPRHPRSHKPLLGGPFNFNGSAQPAFGATMGHGLHSGMKEHFFYPLPNAAVPLSPLMRSASEGLLKKDRSNAASPRNEPKTPPGSGRRQVNSREALDPPPSRGLSRGSPFTSRGFSRGEAGGFENFPPPQEHGFIKAEKGAPAYRSVLHALTADQRAGHS